MVVDRCSVFIVCCGVLSFVIGCLLCWLLSFVVVVCCLLSFVVVVY